MTTNDRLRAGEAFDAAPAGMLIVSADEFGRVLDANPALAALAGIDVSRLRGRTVAELIEPGDRERWQRRLADLVAGDGTAQRFRQRYSSSSGETVHVEVVATRTSGDDGPVLVAHVRDVTPEVQAAEEHEHLEDALRRAKKIDTVGQLAGGMAHDFNNLLSVILNYTQLSINELGGHPAATGLQEVLAAAHRAADLTHELLVLARRDSSRVDTVDLNEVLRENASLLNRTLGDRIAFDVACSGSPLVVANRSQIDQVLLNLVINARDALPDGGHVLVSTEVVTDRGREWACLRAQDDGIGMTREVQQHIFEPFFSTKDEGLGTGLGLAIVYGIVTRAGGSIDVQSEPDGGTVFTVRFPLGSDLSAAPPAAHEGPTTRPSP